MSRSVGEAEQTAGVGAARELSGRGLRAWRWAAVGIGVGGLALDQAAKAVAVARLDPMSPPSLFGGLLKLQLLRNSGAAFSMGSGSTVIISIFAIVALVAVVAVALPRVRRRWTLVSCGMLMAGIGGNLADRLLRPPAVLRGHVVDFFALPHFAVFNVADMFITATAVLVVVMSLFGADRDAGGRP